MTDRFHMYLAQRNALAAKYGPRLKGITRHGRHWNAVMEQWGRELHTLWDSYTRATDYTWGK
jgi:hypothetical protein